MAAVSVMAKNGNPARFAFRRGPPLGGELAMRCSLRASPEDRAPWGEPARNGYGRTVHLHRS